MVEVKSAKVKALAEILSRDPHFERVLKNNDVYKVAEKIKLGLEYFAFKIKNGWERYDFETCRILYEEQRRMKAWKKGKKPIYEIEPQSNSIPSYSTSDNNYSSNIYEMIYEVGESSANGDCRSMHEFEHQSISSNSYSKAKGKRSMYEAYEGKGKKPMYVTKEDKVDKEDMGIKIVPGEFPPMIFDNVEDIAMFIPATSKIPEPKSTAPITSKRTKSKRSRQEKQDESYGLPSSSKAAMTAAMTSIKSLNVASTITAISSSNIASTSTNANINVSPNTFLWNELWNTAAKQNPENAITSESPGEIFHRLWAEHRDTEPGPALAPMEMEPLDNWTTTDLMFSDSILSHMPTIPSSSSSQSLQPLANLLSHMPTIPSSTQSLTNLSPMQTINPTNPHTWPSISIEGPQEPPRTPPHQIRSALDNHSTPGSAFSISEFINMSPDKPDNH
ncbi:3806_t:CDS:2 [Diversispora eburnea]|uniref:3806_t:CDS:1 n=1 Tax=Diversispora eburnea TaxID=1213867 RepID=A0A9N8VPM3_9GLOM|nr:3806_t:CDS:2 [Diversispora eburnea]